MARGLLSFAGGLANGYISEDRRLEEKARTDRLDEMRAQEFGWRKEDADYQRGQRQQAKTLDELEAQPFSAGVPKPVAAVTTTDAQGGTQSFAQPDRQTADFARQQQALEADSAPVAPAVPLASEIQDATSVRALDGQRKLFTGLNSAAEAAKYVQDNPNSNYAKHMAAYNALAAAPGGRKRADEIMARAKELQSEGVMNAWGRLQSGDFEGAKREFDGVGAMKLPEGGRFDRAEEVDPVTGAKRSVFRVMNGDQVVVPDVGLAIRSRLMTPYQAANLDMQRDSNQLTNAVKAQNAAAALSEKQSRDQMMLLLRNGGGGGGNGSGSGAGKAPISPVDDVMERMSKQVESKFTSVTDQNKVAALAKTIFADNGGRVPPERAISSAMDLVSKPELEVPQVDMDTGMIHLVHKGGRDGDVITRRNYAEASQPKDLKPEQLKGLVAGMKASNPAEFEALRDMAFDTTGNAARRYLETVVRPELVKLAESRSNLNTPKLKADFVNNALEQVSAPALRRKAGLLSLYDTEQAKQDGARLTFDPQGNRLTPPSRALQAQAALRALDLSDPAAVDQFQRGPLMGELTAAQKAAVFAASRGRAAPSAP